MKAKRVYLLLLLLVFVVCTLLCTAKEKMSKSVLTPKESKVVANRVHGDKIKAEHGVVDVPKYAEYTDISPEEWSVKDVETWMNITLGYPEYSAIIQTHRIDGLTLLEMDSCDFENYFPLSNPLHAIKFKAHLKLLQHQSDYWQRERRSREYFEEQEEELEEEQEDDNDVNRNDDVDSKNDVREKRGRHASWQYNKHNNRLKRIKKVVKKMDFWQYLRRHNRRTWIEGVTMLYFPRSGMLMSYLFDKDVYYYFTASRSAKVSNQDVPRDGLYSLQNTKANVHSVVKAKNVGSHKESNNKQSDRHTSTMRTIIFWIAFLVAPDLYMAFQAAILIPVNHVTMTLFTLHFIHQGYCEYMLASMWYRGVAFDTDSNILQKIWAVFSYVLTFPFIAVIVTFTFPFFLQYVVIAALHINNLMLLIGLVLIKVDELRQLNGKNKENIYKGFKEFCGFSSANKDDKNAESSTTKDESADSGNQAQHEASEADTKQSDKKCK